MAKAKPQAKSKAKDVKADKAKKSKKVEAPAVKTSKKSAPVKEKKAKKTAEEVKKEFFQPNYDDIVDTVEKKFKLGQGAMSREARLSSQISTGLLCTDILFGGGILPGSWVTCFGGEGSAKSTHIGHMKIAAANSKVPIMADYDYEGSSQPDYYEGIFDFYSTMKDISELYGQKDDGGNWVVRPKVRYYAPSVAEEFFKSAASVLRRIPDKEFVGGRWWYVWDNDKDGKAAAKGQYSKAMLSKYGRLYIEAENGLPQALYFLDSYPAMYPEALDDDDAGRGMAAVARAMSENVPRILSKLRSKAITIIGVNQLRLRPGVSFGNPEYEPAGETVKFASSVRVRQSALVPPSGWVRDKDNYELGKEPSVMYDKAHDRYRYIKMKTIKNKLSTPYITMMQRVWVDDGTGRAHGFDPAYDTYNYMRATGQLSGTIKSLTSPLIDTKKKLEWSDFKGLIVLKGKELKQHCESLGIKGNPNVRATCFKQMASGKGLQMYFDSVRNRSADDEDGGSDDDDE